VYKEFIKHHLLVKYHSVSCTDFRAVVLVEKVLSKDKLHPFELLDPDLLRKVAERAVEFVAGKRGIDLAYITILE